MHCDDGGSHMRKSFVALSLVLGGAAALMTIPKPSHALGDIDDVPAKMRASAAMIQAGQSAARLHSAQDPNDPDTVYIGHVGTSTARPGVPGATGGYGPFHVGRGPNRIWSP